MAGWRKFGQASWHPLITAVLSLTLLCSSVATGSAQLRLRTENDWRQQFRDYLGAPAYLDAVGILIRDVERRLAPDCATSLKGAKRTGLWVRKRILFDGQGPHPNQGQWQDRIAVNRCGQQVLHNLLVTALPDTSPAFKVLLPGDSRADARLQLDAKPAVLAIASAQIKTADCRAENYQIVQADFDRFIGDTERQGLRDRIWREVWTTRVCGRLISVEVKFVPRDGGGYTFVVDLASP